VKQTEGKTDRQRINGETDRRIDVWTDRKTNRCIDEWTERQTNRRKDRQTNIQRTDRRMNRDTD
jgi:hypothetical protein